MRKRERERSKRSRRRTRKRRTREREMGRVYITVMFLNFGGVFEKNLVVTCMMERKLGATYGVMVSMSAFIACYQS